MKRGYWGHCIGSGGFEPVTLPRCSGVLRGKCMRQASSTVLDGFELRADAKTIAFPERYVDERGAVMWDVVNDLLADIEAEVVA